MVVQLRVAVDRLNIHLGTWKNVFTVWIDGPSACDRFNIQTDTTRFTVWNVGPSTFGGCRSTIAGRCVRRCSGCRTGVSRVILGSGVSGIILVLNAILVSGVSGIILVLNVRLLCVSL